MSANPATTVSTRSTTAVLVCAFAILLLSTMDVLMKGLVLAIGVYSAVLWRSALATLIAGIAWASGPRAIPGRRTFEIHARRAFAIGCVLITFFWGLARLPLAEAIALSFVAPLIALGMAALLLGERIRSAAIWGSVAGLAGVAIVIAGQIGRSDYGAEALSGSIAVLGSTVFYAYNLVLARQQSLVARPVEIAFFQNLMLTAGMALAAPWLAVYVPSAAWPYLAGATILSLAGQMLMSWAYARAEAQYLIPIEYTAFVWAILLGWLVFSEQVGWTTVAGAALIIGGCLAALRTRPDLVTEPVDAS
jgi:S-adenosylmethionine uptake transporter